MKYSSVCIALAACMTTPMVLAQTTAAPATTNPAMTTPTTNANVITLITPNGTSVQAQVVNGKFYDLNGNLIPDSTGNQTYFMNGTPVRISNGVMAPANSNANPMTPGPTTVNAPPGTGTNTTPNTTVPAPTTSPNTMPSTPTTPSTNQPALGSPNSNTPVSAPNTSGTVGSPGQ
jgi:hypothetical protein